jgi:putative adhesin
MRLPKLLPALVIAAAPVASLAAQTPDFHWDKTLPAGNDVHVSNINGNIKITPSASGHVVVNGFKHGGRDADRIKAIVEESSRGIEVCVVYDDADASCDGDRGYRGRDHNWNHASIDLDVSVPANLTVSAGSVSGDVSVDGAHGDVNVSAVSGDVHLDHLHATSIRATTVSGEIDVRVDELTGRGDFYFHSVSGDVRLEVPKGFGADLSLTTVSGDIDSDFPITLGGSNRISRRRVEARIGDGGRRLDVSTVSGDLRIRMAK